MYDYLIIGQGIAGSSVAFQLLKKEQTIHVIDQNPDTSSSKIASGLWNPVVLKRMKKVWRADEMVEALHPYYLELQAFIQKEIIDEKHIRRIFFDIEELNNWTELADSPALSHLLQIETLPNTHQEVNAPYGYGLVTQSGRINVNEMLDGIRKHLVSIGALSTQRIDLSQLQVHDDHVELHGIKARHMICCEGYQAKDNPYFNYLPFALTKGEVAFVKSEELTIQHPLHGGKFILPMPNGHYKIGATYDWHQLNEEVTDKGRQQLEKGWNKITNAAFELQQQQAGIRPTVKDRRPLIGSHPEHPRLHIFNGLGSRGILMAPLLSKEFVDYLIDQQELHSELDIKRFAALYTS